MGLAQNELRLLSDMFQNKNVTKQNAMKWKHTVISDKAPANQEQYENEQARNISAGTLRQWTFEVFVVFQRFTCRTNKCKSFHKYQICSFESQLASIKPLATIKKNNQQNVSISNWQLRIGSGSK